jgi:hypothetical protein
MPTSIKKKFDQINELAWDALIEHESNKAYDVIPRKFTQQERFKKEAEVLMKSLESDVQKGLWNAVAAED